jgi:Tfp pilus assembly protein PilW
MLRRRLRAEDGMSLPELLVAISMALIVSLATFSLIEFTMRRSAEVQGRVDATQRGRLTMDTITRQLRSEVCQPSGTPPIYSRAGNVTDNNNVTFFVDFTDGSNTSVPVDMHTIAFDAANSRIVERDYTGTNGANSSIDPTYNAAPYRTTTLLSDVVPVDATTPVFRYFQYGATTPLTTPVVAPSLGTIASIQINYRVLPSKTAAQYLNAGTSAQQRASLLRQSVVFQDLVTVREVDPNAATPSPQCA